MRDSFEPRRLLVVEDESLMAALLSQTLTNEGFAVTTCESAAEARAMIPSVDPDGALIDINLGVGPSGMHLGHILHQAHPHIGLVFLTKYSDPAAAGEGSWQFPPGSAFLSKEHITDTQTLVDVLDRVLGDGENTTVSPPAGPLHKLTRVQREILRLTALGLTNAAIARHRGTNERTVEQRLQSVYQTLEIPINGELNPRVEAVRQYILAAGVPATEELQPA